ncbi:MAG: hypothetical protein FXF47_00415 [Candidatus Mcinerneyibacterium aminivorans]|jgi:hypothetical protein|uniref:Uncharacterized protein n=1 Tax=Candidatus Mcinerneyibacterium aminivorans TaxID=2703815 RepID=A0A5D0MKL2_9BACT|nr:MAG: hypothetical protein FXF47_00415 [Candidatus Mcinerneyibacterium aminivorans]
MYCTIDNNLDKKTIEKLKKLEKDLNATLIAFKCSNPDFAELSEKELEKIQNFEREHDVSLLAFEDSRS